MRALLLPLVVLAGALLGGSAWADCKLEKVAELPVTMAGLRPTVTATINGVEARFLVDSGAFFSSLTSASAAKYGLALSPAPFNLRVRGVGGGDAEVSVATAKNFVFADTPHHHVDFLVLDRIGGGDIAGVIGQNLLGTLDVEYDLANGVIRLFQTEGCGGAMLAYWVKDQQPYSVIDIERTTPLAPNAKAHASLNGAGIIVTFDTGSPRSIVAKGAAARAGVRPEGSVEVGYTSGIAKRSFLRTWRGTFASFKIGDEEIKNTPLLFGDLDLEDADMLIGADFFLSHHLYVAASQHKLYFTYNGGPVFNLDAPPPSASARLASSAAANADAAAANGPTPTDAEGYGRRATAFAARRDLPGAIADLSHAVALAPGDPRYVYRRGQAEFASRQPLLAMADFDQALKLKPNDIDALLARARLYAAERKTVEAQADLDAANRFAASDPDKRLAIAEAYTRMDRPQDAIAQLDQWTSAHPGDDAMAAALNLRCWSRAMLGQDLDKAMTDCNAALKLTPDSPEYLNSRGLVRLRMGDFDRAIADYDAALRVNPNGPWALYGRGLARLHKGMTPEGQADIKAATALNPRLPDEAKAMGLAPPPAP